MYSLGYVAVMNGYRLIKEARKRQQKLLDENKTEVQIHQAEEGEVYTDDVASCLAEDSKGSSRTS